ncbi:hypothetical protein BDB01DRAFT_348921 [Pilobolus umbonatus]|nr:hypothetical protein BDB01DRAFT_348921 [Pilobolus umbonatus]
MITLPAEIVELIIKKLEWKDIRSCSTVNRQFYSTLIKYLYREVCVRTNANLNLFLDSLVLYPRYIEIGIHVRKLILNIPYAINEYSFGRYSNVKVIHFLMQLPNLEEIAMRPSIRLIQALTNTRKPILTKVKKLDFYFHTDGACYKYADCCYRYRSSIATLSGNDLYLSNDELIPYLASFPCLDELRDLSSEEPMVLTDVLDACPMLTKLDFTCESTSIHHPDLPKKQTYLLEKLHLSADHMALEVIQFIRDSLPQLKSLKLTIENGLEEFDAILDTVWQIRSLKTMKVNFPGFFNIDIVHMFVDTLKKYKEMSEVMKRETIVKQNYSTARPYFTIEYQRGSHSTTENRLLIGMYNMQLLLEDLDHMGKNLDTLTLHPRYRVHAWSLEDINERCLMLSELFLVHFKLIPFHGQGTVNKHLTMLSIESITVNCSILKNINECYPMLKHFHLKSVDLISDDDYDEIQCIELPVTSLKLDRSDVGNCEWSIVVVKTVEGVWIKSWHYCSQRKGMIVSDGPLTKYDLGQLMEGIIYVFECSLVEDVVFGP